MNLITGNENSIEQINNKYFMNILVIVKKSE